MEFFIGVICILGLLVVTGLIIKTAPYLAGLIIIGVLYFIFRPRLSEEEKKGIEQNLNRKD
jgi:hypothetical protein